MYRILFTFLLHFYFSFTWSQTYNIIDYGAKPEADFINTNAINSAINECSSKGDTFLFTNM